MTARVTTGNPSSHLAHSSAIITNHFITPSALWLSRHLYSPPASAGLRKCLDVKFKQHKCLPAKQSSSESCGTQSSFYFLFFWCGRGETVWHRVVELQLGFFFFLSNSEARSLGSCIVFFSSWGKQHLKLASVAQLLCLSLTSSPLVPFSLCSTLVLTCCLYHWTFHVFT